MATCTEECFSSSNNSVQEIEERFLDLNLNHEYDKATNKTFEKCLGKELFLKYPKTYKTKQESSDGGCESREQKTSENKKNTESDTKHGSTGEIKHKKNSENNSKQTKSSRIKSGKIKLRIKKAQEELHEQFGSLSLEESYDKHREGSLDASTADDYDKSVTVHTRGPVPPPRSIKNVNRHAPFPTNSKDQQKLHLSGCSEIIEHVESNSARSTPLIDLSEQAQLFNILPGENSFVGNAEHLSYLGSPDSGFCSPMSESCLSPPTTSSDSSLNKNHDASYVLSQSDRERVDSSSSSSEDVLPRGAESFQNLETILHDLYQKNDAYALSEEECGSRLNDICELIWSESSPNDASVSDSSETFENVSLNIGNENESFLANSQENITVQPIATNASDVPPTDINQNVVGSVVPNTLQSSSQNAQIVINNYVLPILMVPMVSKSAPKPHSLPPLLPKPSGEQDKNSARLELQKALDLPKKVYYQKEIYNKIRGKKKQEVIVWKDKASKQTNLHLAVKNGNKELVYCLVEIQNQVNKEKAIFAINLCDSFGKTARDYSTDHRISAYLDMFRPKERVLISNNKKPS